MARDSDKGIEYLRWIDHWHRKRSLDINVGRVDRTLLHREVCIKFVDDALMGRSSPQITRDCPNPGLEVGNVALYTVKSVSVGALTGWFTRMSRWRWMPIADIGTRTRALDCRNY